MTYKLYPHQSEASDYALAHNYSINSMSMGTGKTLVGIDLIARTKLRTLVIAPAFLTRTWESEINKFTDLKCQIVKNSKAKVNKDVIRIASYSSLKNLEEVFKEVDLVICDEIHYLKNIDAKRTQHFHEYMSNYKPYRFLGLTGTPIKNRVTEWFSLLAICGYNPENNSGQNVLKFFPTYWQFARTFCYEKKFKIKGRIVTQFEGHRNVERLRELLVGKYFRVKASEVLNLPPITRKDIILEPDKIDHELLAAFEERNTKKNFMKSKVNSAMIKVPHTVKYAKDLEDQGEGPLLIFSSHIDSAQDIAKRLKYTLITGKTSMESRDKLVSAFQEGLVPGLVATTGSLSVGVTLTRASNMIFNDLPWTPGDLAQAEKRIHRIGQEKHSTIHRVLWGQVDKHICKTLDKKIETMKEVL